MEPEAVAARDPQVVIASWCGMKVKKQEILSRPGWESTIAAQCGRVYEIPSGCILQPGSAALTDGVRQLHAILARVVGVSAAQMLGQSEAGETYLL